MRRPKGPQETDKEFYVDEIPFSWARGAEGPWHRISGFPEAAGTAMTLCNLALTFPPGTSSEPPPDRADRCDACEIEGAAAPPNH